VKTQELIDEVFTIDKNDSYTLYEFGLAYRKAAPKLARMLQKAIEQRDEVLDGMIHSRTEHIDEYKDMRNAELDRIAEGKE